MNIQIWYKDKSGIFNCRCPLTPSESENLSDALRNPDKQVDAKVIMDKRGNIAVLLDYEDYKNKYE